MEDLISRAGHYHDEAEAMKALAQTEAGRERRRIMESAAELLFLLHDKFLELGEPPAQVITLRR